VLIDALRDDPRATSVVEQAIREGAASSEVTRYEVLAGMRMPEEEEATETLFAQLEWLEVSETVARVAAALAAEFRGRSSGIEDADYLIAATAVVAGRPLLTTNVRHFPMFPDLRPAY
jgi:predicted nucleic acid-binding protein